MSIPDHIGVYGGGRMGAGIAHAFLQSGASVTIVESDDRTAAAARERVSNSPRSAKTESSRLRDMAGAYPC